ncbi:MAG: hypothetical protein UX79_C0006G0028 [candidate division WWE3 bacterium GW2011_GWB1_47_11]|uniref:Uncharacterized protein n=1 Tax=candidate division WWE3 bacterium GW2011_GWB1_47_11 TaxID=1619117 RepID=A0A0G1RKU0_UNCKA|nr:MAG: hypothetical protein UX79_C0006G0028 [candidate division WWE3 bacterium GW2011_GWB1_47_11]
MIIIIKGYGSWGDRDRGLKRDVRETRRASTEAEFISATNAMRHLWLSYTRSDNKAMVVYYHDVLDLFGPRDQQGTDAEES